MDPPIKHPNLDVGVLFYRVHFVKDASPKAMK
jgi:hypothetical protein